RWCTLSDLEQRKCAELSKVLLVVLPLATVNSFTRVSCIRAQNTHDCIDKIRVNKADAVSLDAGDVYSAVKLYGLTVVAKEIYEEALLGNCVFAVAVARRGSLDIQRLGGVRSCHNGARWTSGWNIPLGFLLARNELHWNEDQPLSQVISQYFNASCIPGVGVTSPQLCALCQGPKSYVRNKNHFCETSSSEPFYDSEGAFRCLKRGVADVAFLDHLIIMNGTGWVSLHSFDSSLILDSEQEEYELLCPDGSTEKLSAYGTCNLGRGPGRAIVSRHNFQKITKKFLTMIQHLFGQKGKERDKFELFASAPFRGKNLLFRDATQHLQLLEGKAEISHVLGLDYVALLKGLGHEVSPAGLVPWCCISRAELRKCEEWALSIKSHPLVCVQATSMTSCIKLIKSNEADVATLDATHAYVAGVCGLVSVAAECYDTEDSRTSELPPIYAVALAKKNARHLNIHNLRGRRSCHSHLYSPGGWLLLSRYTVGALENNTVNCDIGSAYQSYFWKGCMPGAGGNLCKVCIGEDEMEGAKVTSRCAGNHNERYYGNMGALRCLVGSPNGRNFGDVAFLEHHNLLKNIKILRSSGWAKGYTLNDFELLCPDGRRVAVTDWADCNLGPVPPNIVMTRPVTMTKIYNFLMKSQESLAMNLDSKFHLFNSQEYGESDLLFKDATHYLVLTDHQAYRSILGKAFFQLAESVFNCTHAAAARGFPQSQNSLQQLLPLGIGMRMFQG
uniref:Transferrin-like domain-containing protein n=1 Tax=Pelodiscus sinensis TaxID=13735 RepID=K7GGW5_PELSI